MTDVIGSFQARMSGFVDAAFGAMLSVAPEREQDLRATMEAHGIRLEPVTVGAFFQAQPHDDATSHIKWRIQASPVGCYFVWAFVNYQFVHMQRVYAAANGSAVPDDSHGEYSALDWAASAVAHTEKGHPLESEPQLYPTLMGYPPPPNANKDPDYWVSEVALAGIGWILQHELVHAIEQHRAPTSVAENAASRRNEATADRGGVDWVLNQQVANDTMMLKRSLGIVSAVLSFVELECRLGFTSDGPHPPAAERLLDAAQHCSMHSVALDYGAVVMLELAARFGFSTEPSSTKSFEVLRDQAVNLLRSRK